MKRNLLLIRKKLHLNDVPIFDPCPVCEEELYYKADLTNRVALVDEDDEGKFIGWICPYCISKFNNEDRVVILMGDKFQGEG